VEEEEVRGSGEGRGPVEGRAVRLAGGLATGLCLALLWVIAAFAPKAVPFAPTSLADAIIRAMPGDVSTFFIELFKEWAIKLFAIGVMVATLFFGSLALGWSRRGREEPRPTLAGLSLAVLAGLAIVVGPGDRESYPGMAIALSATAGVYAVVATWFLGRLREERAEAFDPARRRALRMGIGGAVGVAVGGGFLGYLVQRLGGPNRDVKLVAPEVSASIPPRGPFPSIPGLTPEITTAEDHYVVDINLVQPSVGAEDWTLKVTGLVDRPLELNFEELQTRFPVVEEYSVLTCISNEVGGDLVGNSLWGGVRLRDVLSEAGVREGAVDVVFHADEGYTDSIPLDIANDESVLLAVSQNREPLLQEHGFPCRVRVPMIYGMKNVKWLREIEVVDEDYQGYWMQRGWSDEAVIHTQSRIDVAGESRRATSGQETWIAGVAWAGGRGIDKVEVSADGGKTWAEAMLKQPVSRYAWTLWAYRWAPSQRGTVEVVARATDGTGEVQTDATAPPHPSGSTGLHRVSVKVS
jgi:DMSO/TMAO reductase YedYZ molybdopterin-dependent catalytic subunit